MQIMLVIVKNVDWITTSHIQICPFILQIHVCKHYIMTHLLTLYNHIVSNVVPFKKSNTIYLYKARVAPSPYSWVSCSLSQFMSNVADKNINRKISIEKSCLLCISVTFGRDNTNPSKFDCISYDLAFVCHPVGWCNVSAINRMSPAVMLHYMPNVVNVVHLKRC